MKSEKLLELIGSIDEELITSASASEPAGRGAWLRWAAAAAAVVLVVCAGMIILGRQDHTPDSPVVSAHTNDGAAITGTSDTYQSLDQLLSYLSRHDNHSSDRLSEGGSKGSSYSADGSGYSEGANAVIVNGHSCHVGQNGVVISRLEGDAVATLHTIEGYSSQLLACGNYLIIVCQMDTSSPESDFVYQLDLQVSVYDLTRPASPQLIMAVSQTGSFCGAFISDGILWLLSSDGECACGYSRLEDRSEYIPTVTIDGQPVELTDEQLHILGEPSIARYLAVTGLRLNDLTVTDTQVLYGDINCVFYGGDYLALEVWAYEDGQINQPEVYVFGLDEKVSYDGKINTASILNIPQSCRASSNDAQSFDLIALSKHSGQYRLTGTLYTGSSGSSRLAAFSVKDDLSGWSAALSQEISGSITLTEVLDEPSRQIVCYSTFAQDYSQLGHFAFVLYDEELTITLPDTNIDHMDGIDMIVSYGSPYGQFSTLIPVGDGTYLRYGGTPDRIAVYDLSDSQQPVPLNDSVILEEIQRFSYQHHIYDDNRIGMITLTPGLDDEGKYNYRENYLTCEYVVYEYDTSAHILFPVARYGTSGYDGLTLLEHDGRYYCVTDGADAPVPVS